MKWTKKQLGNALKVTIPLAIIITGLIIFSELAEDLLEDELQSFDEAIIAVIQQTITDPMIQLATFTTHMGDAITIIVLAAIMIAFLLYKRRFALAIFIAVANLFGGLFNWILKAIFARDRPTIEVLIEQGGYSFPSGHAMGSMILYGSLAMVIVLLADRLSVGIAYSVLTFFVIFFIGLSRVYLGVHYPSDVFAGFALGAAWLTICFSGYLLYQSRK